MLSALRAIERVVDEVVQRVSVVVLVGMILVITIQIISRVLFDAVSWSEELARYLLVWITFLGATLAWSRGRHIAVSFIADAAPSAVRRLIQLGTLAVSAAFFAIIVVIGIRYMRVQSFQVSASLRIPMAWVYTIMPVSATLMLFYTVIDGLELFGAVENGPESPDSLGSSGETE
jgi:TRAP-type C4-dicarboxylate transport system permease small subunit